MSAPSAVLLREQVTGLVLAGGRAQRMGGVDKGLVPWRGRPLAMAALERLAAQVGPLAVNANRHLADYAALGVPVWPDDEPGFQGPLAGVQTALARCTTPWLACVPCDVPAFPTDLVARLGLAAMAAQADAACVQTFDAAGSAQVQPVFMLLRARPRGQRPACAGGVWPWLQGQHHVVVSFDDATAFRGANSPAELAALDEPGGAT